MTIDLSRRKELDADPEAIHQIEFAWQLKKLHHDYNATDADNDQSMFVSIILKIKEMKLKFSQRSVTVLSIITNYYEKRAKLTYTQLNKLRSAAEKGK